MFKYEPMRRNLGFVKESESEKAPHRIGCRKEEKRKEKNDQCSVSLRRAIVYLRQGKLGGHCMTATGSSQCSDFGMCRSGLRAPSR
jgi:hypothetical protein